MGMHQSEASFDQWLPPCAEYLAAPRNATGISAAGAINNSSSTNTPARNFDRSNGLTEAALASRPASNFINNGKERTPGVNSAVGAVSSMSLCGGGQHSGAASFPTIVKKEPGGDIGRSTTLTHTSHPPNLSTHIIDNGGKCRASGTACVVSSISPCSVEQKKQLEASLIPTVLDNASDMLSLPVDLLTSQYKSEIFEALKKLKESQRREYKNAKERLYSQMERVLAQYNQLEEEKRSLARSSISSLEVFDDLMEKTLIQFAGLKNERDNFELMLSIRNGYGSISQDTLRRLFEWPPHSEKLDR